MKAAERLMGVRSTRQFILANSVRVQLRRPVVTKSAAGGTTNGAPEVLPAQTFRIVPMSGLVWDRSVTTPDEGRIADVTEILIGMPECDVQVNDWFPNDTGFMLIVHVSPVRGYRRECRLRWVKTQAELP